MMRCSHCGKSIDDDSTFCGSCGQSVQIENVPTYPGMTMEEMIVTSTSEDLDEPLAPEDLHDDEVDTDIDLNRPASHELIIGRSTTCHVLLDEPSVSQLHAKIVRQGNQLYLKDLGSSNGTYVNGEKILRTRITPRNKVRFGAIYLPWNHPQIKVITRGISDSPPPDSDVHQPTQRADADTTASPPQEHEVTPEETTQPQTDENRKSAPRLSPRRLFLGLVILAFLVFPILIVVLWTVLPYFEPPVPQTNPVIPENEVPLPAIAPPTKEPSDVPEVVLEGGVTDPLFTPEGPAFAGEHYEARVTDQVDIRPFESLVTAVRVGIRSAVTWPGQPGNLQIRDHWAVPLGRIELPWGKALAMLTSRCAIDFRYPAASDVDRIANLAITVSSSQGPKIFRIARPTDLPGVTKTTAARRVKRLRKSRFWRSSQLRKRYFEILVPGKAASGEAHLVSGQWDSDQGPDMSVLMFPESDEDVASLRPRGMLGFRGQPHLVGLTYSAGQSRWLAQVDFENQEPRCSFNIPLAPEPSAADRARFELAASATALSQLTSLLGEGAAPERFRRTAALMLDRAWQREGATWSLSIVSDLGNVLQDVDWNSENQLVLQLEIAGNRKQAILAGVERSGLDNETAARVLTTVRALAAAPSAHIALLQAEESRVVASLFVRDARIETSAELLRRGVIRLDMRDRELHQQQPTLLEAAFASVRDARTNQSGVNMNAEYRGALESFQP